MENVELSGPNIFINVFELRMNSLRNLEIKYLVDSFINFVVILILVNKFLNFEGFF